MEGSDPINYLGSGHVVGPQGAYSEGTSSRVSTCFQEVATLERPRTIQTNLYGSHVAAVVPAFASKNQQFWEQGLSLNSHLVWNFREHRDMSEWFVRPHSLSLLPQNMGHIFVGY